MNLSGVDLNLLVLLDALLEEESVTRAAVRVGLTQPAASNALKRLRLLLGDPLLEKDGRRMRLTDRARQLRLPLGKALEDLRNMLRGPAPFDPRIGAARFRLFASDHVVFVLMPILAREMALHAPAAEMTFHWTRGDQAVDLLESGAVDLAVGRYNNTPGPICRAKLYEEILVAQARRGHPIFEGPLTPEAFAAHPRIATSFDGRTFGDQEQAMARAGIPVRSRFVMPHLLAAPMLTLDADLITIAPRRMAERLAALVPLDWRPLPFDAPPILIEMIWHERTSADPALVWLRGLLRSIGAGL